MSDLTAPLFYFFTNHYYPFQRGFSLPVIGFFKTDSTFKISRRLTISILKNKKRRLPTEQPTFFVF